MEPILTREQQLEKALFRGDSLTLQNPNYLHEVRTLMEELLRQDLAPREMCIRDSPAAAQLIELQLISSGYEAVVCDQPQRCLLYTSRCV